MKPVPHANELVIAAFFTEGLNDAGYDNVIESWNRGAYELIQEITAYAPYLEGLLNAGHAATNEWGAGVFDYEVSSPFGSWFGLYVIEHPEMAPPEHEARAWLMESVADFLSQWGDEAQKQRDRQQVMAALREFDQTYPGTDMPAEAPAP